jgi:hypothetical protein
VERMTHDRSSSSGEPLDLAILDEELGEVLRVSNLPMSPFYNMLNSKSSEQRDQGKRGNGWWKGKSTYPINILYGRSRVLFQILPDRLGVRSIDVSLPVSMLPRPKRIDPTYLLCDWESNSVIELTEL